MEINEEVYLDLVKMSMTPHAINNMTPLLGYPKVSPLEEHYYI
jgi:hypothetical protein